MRGKGRRTALRTLEVRLTIDGTLSTPRTRWDRKAFAFELAEARSAMPMSESVMQQLRREARY